jgi:hypothetical protein
VSREVLYNILIQFSIPMKLVRLIKMYLNETYSEVHIGQTLSCISYSDWSETRCLSPLLFNLALEYAIRKDLN